MTEYKREKPRLCTNAMDKPEIWDAEGHLAEALRKIELLAENMRGSEFEKYEHYMIRMEHHILAAWDKLND